MIDVAFAPIDTWPGPLRPDHERKPSRFTASHRDTMNVLTREVWQLGADRLIIRLDVAGSQIRRDGMLNERARIDSPRIVAEFPSRHGQLRYGVDTFRDDDASWASRYVPGWQANLRALALGLEALRAVDRYGIGGRGEQYQGWKALGAGFAMSSFTVHSAACFVADHADVGADGGDIEVEPGRIDRDAADRLYKLAAKRLHPDIGGDTTLFQQLQDAKRVLDEAAS